MENTQGSVRVEGNTLEPPMQFRHTDSMSHVVFSLDQFSIVAYGAFAEGWCPDMDLSVDELIVNSHRFQSDYRDLLTSLLLFDGAALPIFPHQADGLYIDRLVEEGLVTISVQDPEIPLLHSTSRLYEAGWKNARELDETTAFYQTPSWESFAERQLELEERQGDGLLRESSFSMANSMEAIDGATLLSEVAFYRSAIAVSSLPFLSSWTQYLGITGWRSLRTMAPSWSESFLIDIRATTASMILRSRSKGATISSI